MVPKINREKAPEFKFLHNSFSLLRFIIDDRVGETRSLALSAVTSADPMATQGPLPVRSNLAPRHPAEELQRAGEMSMAAGAPVAAHARVVPAMCIGLGIERRILSSIGPLPGIRRSNVGLECSLGIDEDIDFGDFMGRRELRPGVEDEPLWRAMEARYF